MTDVISRSPLPLFSSSRAVETSAEPMRSGWEELGISDQRASEIANEMNEEDSFSFNGDAFYKVTYLTAKKRRKDYVRRM